MLISTAVAPSAGPVGTQNPLASGNVVPSYRFGAQAFATLGEPTVEEASPVVDEAAVQDALAEAIMGVVTDIAVPSAVPEDDAAAHDGAAPVDDDADAPPAPQASSPVATSGGTAAAGPASSNALYPSVDTEALDGMALGELLEAWRAAHPGENVRAVTTAVAPDEDEEEADDDDADSVDDATKAERAAMAADPVVQVLRRRVLSDVTELGKLVTLVDAAAEEDVVAAQPPARKARRTESNAASRKASRRTSRASSMAKARKGKSRSRAASEA